MLYSSHVYVYQEALLCTRRVSSTDTSRWYAHGGAMSDQCAEEMTTKLWQENFQQTDRLEDNYVEGTTILKRT